MTSVVFESIKPSLAESYLATSRGNRGMKEAKVNAYARDMASGDWHVNGETIIFDEGGALIDGHHRLAACVKSGQPFTGLVVRGVPKGAQKTIDMGASRTVGDVLSFHGYANSNHLNAVVIAAMSLANGRPRSANPSSSEVFAFLEKYPSAQKASTIAARKHLPRCQAILGAIWLVASETGREQIADEFLHVLSSGIPSRDGCPAHVFREKILRDKASTKPMPLADAHRLAVSAWNKFADGESVKTIRAGKYYRIEGWGR